MKAAVIGGKLQGVEAAWLAHRANWAVLAVDRNENAPVRGLADVFYSFDIFESDKLAQLIHHADIVIPAIENSPALDFIYRTARELGKPVLFDPAAYELSSSKLRSDAFFLLHNIPAPRKWPGCDFPLIAKPSGLSGSHGVQKLHTIEGLNALKTRQNGDLQQWVLQEFVDGPSYSIEIMANKGICRTFQVTELEMDDVYDCKRVLAPAGLSPRLLQAFSDCAVKLARAIRLDGIMDVEVIRQGDVLKVLEIDARLPSQTPTAVLLSSGINMLSVWADGLTDGNSAEYTMVQPCAHVLYEHILVTPDRVMVAGEHIMAGRGPLHSCQKFFGADEAITNYQPQLRQPEWVATLLLTASSRAEVRAKEQAVIQRIMKEVGAVCYEDPKPAV